MVGSSGNRIHGPLRCKQDKRPGGVPMIPSVAYLGEGEVYLRGEPIFLQERPKGDSEREEGICGVYYRLLKLAIS